MSPSEDARVAPPETAVADVSQRLAYHRSAFGVGLSVFGGRFHDRQTINRGPPGGDCTQRSDSPDSFVQPPPLSTRLSCGGQSPPPKTRRNGTSEPHDVGVLDVGATGVLYPTCSSAYAGLVLPI